MNIMRGFTLVELAIVLVIIGLLTGGVLAGADLIAQAKIRKTMSQLADYDRAALTFRLKYGSLPGDFNRAAAFGIDRPEGGAMNLSQTAVPISGSLEGDNNKRIDFYGDLLGAGWQAGELLNFWVHLSNSKLVKGDFTQTPNCSIGCPAIAGPNVPATPIGTGVLIVQRYSCPEFNDGFILDWDTLDTCTSSRQSTDVYFYLSIINNADNAGASLVEYFTTPLYYSPTGNTNMTAAQSSVIDTKLDDGKPITGKVRAVGGYGSNWGPGLFYPPYEAYGITDTQCVTATNQYNVKAPDTTCSLAIKASF